MGLCATALFLSLTFSVAATAKGANEGSISVAFEGDATEHPSEGHTTLSWDVTGAAKPDAVICQLQEATAPGFKSSRVMYEGDGHQLFVSGLPNGKHEYRVRCKREANAAWSSWSETKTLSVAHHSLTLALVLFGVGGVIFFSTAGFVFWHRDAASTSET